MNGWTRPIRRKGIYFAMITLAMAQMVYFVWLQSPFRGSGPFWLSLREASVMLLDLHGAGVKRCKLDLNEAGEDRSQLMNAMGAIGISTTAARCCWQAPAWPAQSPSAR